MFELSERPRSRYDNKENNKTKLMRHGYRNNNNMRCLCLAIIFFLVLYD